MDEELLGRLREILIPVEISAQGQKQLLSLLLLIAEKLLKALRNIFPKLLWIVHLAEELEDPHIREKGNIRSLILILAFEDADELQRISCFFEAVREPHHSFYFLPHACVHLKIPVLLRYSLLDLQGRSF